jgi:hypothetical protein
MLKWNGQGATLYFSYNNRGALNLYLKVHQGSSLSFTCWNFSQIAKNSKVLERLSEKVFEDENEIKELLKSEPVVLRFPCNETESFNLIVLPDYLNFRGIMNSQSVFDFPVPFEDIFVVSDFISSYKTALVVADIIEMKFPSRRRQQAQVQQSQFNNQVANFNGLPNPNQF